jgi:spore coat polysaccharide biosynthesis protein SpsF
MKIGIILQARMGSTRLPGKVLMKADETNLMLDYSINQLKYCMNSDKMIIATSNLKRDDPIEEHCKISNIDFFRGDEQDVLDRHYQCAKKYSLSHIVRIPSDKPLIDPQIVDSIIEFFKKNDFDYVANFEIIQKNNSLIFNSTYPSGTEVEIFSFNALEMAWKNAKSPDEREHVTPHLYLNPKIFKIKHIHQSENLSHFRWSLDYENDMYLIREIIKGISNRPILTNDIIKLLDENPKLYKINNTSN